MSWYGAQGNWTDSLVPKDECTFYPFLEGMTGHDAPTGPFSIIMASLIRYCHMQRVVELGVYKGGTTILLADACRSTGGCCIAVDQDSCDEARARIARFGLGHPHCVFVQARTAEAPYDGEPIDLLFIDAGHSLEDITRDWIVWSPRVKAGGWIFIDNSRSEVGVRDWWQGIKTDLMIRRWEFVECTVSFGVLMLRKPE